MKAWWTSTGFLGNLTPYQIKRKTGNIIIIFDVDIFYYNNNKSNALAAAHGISMHHLREYFYNFMKRKINIHNVWFYLIVFHSKEENDNVKINPCEKCETEFLMSFWWQFGQRHQIRRKSHHFLSKCHENSMTWTCPKSMSCSSMENK